MTTPYGQSAQTTSYSTNSLNEYTSVGGTSQSSDANGNLTDNGTYLFAYDYKNHIVQVKLKSSGVGHRDYRYDALGRRVEKSVGGTVERHILSLCERALASSRTSRTSSQSTTARTSGSRTSSGATRWTASRCSSRRTCSTSTRTGTRPR